MTGTKLATVTTTKQNSQTKSKNPTRFFEVLKRHYIKGSILLVNIGLFAGVAVLASSSEAQSSQPLQSASPGILTASAAEEPAGPLDELSSADIAFNVAKATALPEVNSVKNKADTISAGLAVASADEKVVTKPQIVSEGLKSKQDIIKYKTKKGDTVKSIAKKFGIKPATVKNSNNLDGNTVAVGVELLISPVDGLVYQVSSGDTPSSLAKEYDVNKGELIAINDAELTNKFKAGEYIIIPDGVPREESGSTSSSLAYGSVGSFSFGVKPVYRENAYAYGWCTWHAANRRFEIGKPIPSNMGNAISWLSVAQAAGLPTGSQPRAGAVLYHLNPPTSLGHVAFVEKVNKDGSFLVSDMNYPIWGTVTYRTVPASETSQYRFIY